MQQDNNSNPNQTMVNQLFGSVFGNVEQHITTAQEEPTPTSQQPSPATQHPSPVYLAKRKGNKIDLIRIANAIYELGMVEDANGGRLTKKEYMITIGKAFNIDLSDYDKDLSNSMASSVAFEKQARIFDDMKEKHLEIYNSK